MRFLSFNLLFVLLALPVFSQEHLESKNDTLPESIYFSDLQKPHLKFATNFLNSEEKFNFRFLKFDEERLEANLTNMLYFDAFSKKPTSFYLETYKKLYNQKGQTSTFFKVEKLYEVYRQPFDIKHNK